MQVIVESYFGKGTGVKPDVIGKTADTLVCEDSDQLLMISEILSCIAQKRDVYVMFSEE